MAQTVGDIAVRVGADTSGLTRGLNDAEGKLSSFGAKAGATAGHVAALGAAAIAAGAAIAGALAVKGFEAVDMLDEMAEKSGASVKAMQSLKLALGEAGIGTDQMQAGIKKLNLAIGEAQSGNVKAQETFQKLGLSVSELAGMDADQRFAMIADAVQGYGNAADRAVVASEIFGAKIGPDLAAAMAQGGDAIRQASSDIERMGLAISDIDAAQVGAANDAFERAKMAVDGVANKLAVELAPLIEAISKSFLKAGESGGGFGGMVSAAVSGAIKAVAFFANAVDGVKRIGQVVADTLIYGFAYVQESFLKLARSVMATLDAIPGIDLTANVRELEDRIRTSQGVMREAAANMRKQFETPLAGDVFLDYAEKAKTASREAATAAVEARKAAQGGESAQQGGEESPAVKKAKDESEKLKQIADAKAQQDAERAALERETLAANMAAKLADLEAGLMSEREVMAADLEAKRQQILMANELGVGDKESNQLLLEQLEAEHNAKIWDMDKKASDERTAQAKAEAAAKNAILAKAFGGLTSLMNSESRKMFEIGKAASIAQATVATFTGMAEALKLGFPLGPIAAAAIGLNGFAQVANIRKQSFGGGGGGAGAGSATTAINAANTPVSGGGNQTANAPTQRTNVTLIGDTFGRDQVIGLLNEAFKDGFTLSGA